MKTDEDVPDILLVDNDAQNIKGLLHTINVYKPDCTVKVIRSGPEAIAFLLLDHLYEPGTSRMNLKFILLSSGSPEIDGLEILQLIKAHPHTRRIPVIMVMQLQDRGLIYQNYAQGANSCVVQPVEDKEFTYLISSLFSYWNEVNIPR